MQFVEGEEHLASHESRGWCCVAWSGSCRNGASHHSPLMSTAPSPWNQEKVRARLPDPADATSAFTAGRWQTVCQTVDLERLPVTLEIREGETAMTGVRWLLRIAAGAALFLGGGAWFLYGDRISTLEKVLATVLLPGMLMGLALWIWLVHRRTPRWERLRLAPGTVQYESGTVRWVEPIPAYAGLALRHHRTQKASRRRQRHGRTALERTLRVGDDVVLWWIELVHDDPARTAVLWASDKHFAASDGLERVEQLSERLHLPVLSTSTIRSVAGPGPRSSGPRRATG